MSNLTKLFLLVCILFAVMHFVNSSPSFNGPTGGIAATQLSAGGQPVSVTVDPQATRYLALYHSAGWCGPGRAFTPCLNGSAGFPMNS